MTHTEYFLPIEVSHCPLVDVFDTHLTERIKHILNVLDALFVLCVLDRKCFSNFIVDNPLVLCPFD